MEMFKPLPVFLASTAINLFCKRLAVFFTGSFVILFLLLSITTQAQTGPSKKIKEKLLQVYQQVANSEISFEQFVIDNVHLFAGITPVNGELLLPLTTHDLYYNNVGAYCTNGNFEFALQQPDFTGGYGAWVAPGKANLLPSPFLMRAGFSSGNLNSSAAHQTIINKTAGNDPVTGIPLVPPLNSYDHSLRLGNTAYSFGTESIAKTIDVTLYDTVKYFYYAAVFQDPGHAPEDQPSFSVRAYDCATWQELPHVCNLGNGSNTIVSKASSPFFTSKNSSVYGKIAYRNWSRAQIDLSAYVGKKVLLVFTNKDCGRGKHWGYTYIDDLFSTQCPQLEPGLPDSGHFEIIEKKTSNCGQGQMCFKYRLPSIVVNHIKETGNLSIRVDIYQDGKVIGELNSPYVMPYSPDSTICLTVNPQALGLDESLGGFDYVAQATFSLTGYPLWPVNIGSQPFGQQAGYNNDYHFSCDRICNLSVSNSNYYETDFNGDGAVKLIVSGGYPPYRFEVNGLTNTTGYFLGLSAGGYVYTITDSRNCTLSGANSILRVTSLTTPVGCPHDSTVVTKAGECTTVLQWAEPTYATYPDSISIAGGIALPKGTLRIKGIYNNHGYYQSDDYYSWQDASNQATFINAHLVTFGDAAENEFIKDHLPQPSFGSWIGLHSTGEPGQFEWVTKEPINFTNWRSSEPSNDNGTATTVGAPYVHILSAGGVSGWNDLPPNWNLPFIVEYENPVIYYNQIAGPLPGTVVGPGVYNICYQVFNLSSGFTTCCFNLTVVCNTNTAECPKDTVITVAGNNCTTPVTWNLPSAKYPGKIPIAGGISFSEGSLNLRGEYNGHGYYQSDDNYSWPEARDIAAGSKGHLVTITDEGESSFIKATLPQPDFGAWIGLYNTGTPGSFAWTTGEPFSYSNWNYGEPNNNNGTPTTVAEPYVHILAGAPKDGWNDLSADWKLPFISEFDTPQLTYTQVSGIPYGSVQGPGVYPICYKVVNNVNGDVTSCCFNVTVACQADNNTRISNSTNNAKTPIENSNQFSVKGLAAMVYPNPGLVGAAFSVKNKTDNLNDKISIKVFDIMGRLVETKAGVVPNSITTMGSKYRPGSYMIQVVQGNKMIPLKLTKQ